MQAKLLPRSMVIWMLESVVPIGFCFFCLLLLLLIPLQMDWHPPKMHPSPRRFEVFCAMASNRILNGYGDPDLVTTLFHLKKKK
jgi:hypothetical protein